MDTKGNEESKETKITGLRLTAIDLLRLERIAARRTDGNKTDAMRLLIREEDERLSKDDLLLIVEELRQRILQLENKKS